MRLKMATDLKMLQLISRFRWRSTILAIYFLFYCILTGNQVKSDRELTYTPVRSLGTDGIESSVEIWVYKGMSPVPFRLFTTAQIDIRRLTTSNSKLAADEEQDDFYQLYQSSNRSKILEDHHADRRFFGWFRWISVWKTKQLPAFQTTYLGISTSEAYTIRVQVTNMNFLYFVLFTLGLIGFFSSKRLARNTLFYYSTGAGFGLMASLLILVFILYKVMPKKSMAYSVLIGGWSFSFYILYTLWQNLSTLLLQYQKWMALYFVSVILISSAVCYRVGPPTNPKSLNLLHWTMQTISLLMIFTGCQIPEMGIAICAAALLVNNVPEWLIRAVKRAYKRVFPTTRKLISMEEYERIGRDSTRKALEDLREYCRSPKCDSWRVIGRLQSPNRFTLSVAEFVEGNSHLNDNELLLASSDVSSHESSDEMVEDDHEDEVSDDDESRTRNGYYYTGIPQYSQSFYMGNGRDSRHRKQLPSRPSANYSEFRKKRYGLDNENYRPLSSSASLLKQSQQRQDRHYGSFTAEDDLHLRKPPAASTKTKNLDSSFRRQVILSRSYHRDHRDAAFQHLLSPSSFSSSQHRISRRMRNGESSENDGLSSSNGDSDGDLNSSRNGDYYYDKNADRSDEATSVNSKLGGPKNASGDSSIVFRRNRGSDSRLLPAAIHPPGESRDSSSPRPSRIISNPQPRSARQRAKFKEFMNNSSASASCRSTTSSKTTAAFANSPFLQPAREQDVILPGTPDDDSF